MKNILIWGNASYYEKHVNLIRFEQYKGNIDILAYISKDKGYQSEQDGKPVILPEDISKFNYDYIIVANSFFKEIIKSAIGLGISEDVLIPIDVFAIPMFDFNQYIRIKERKFSIVAESCYGAYLYKTLGLKLTSPFIDVRISSKDYIKLLGNFEYYLSQPFEMGNDNRIATINGDEWLSGPDTVGEPIAKLDDVKINLLHDESFELRKVLWEKRLARFNKADVIVLMIIENDLIAEAFDNLKIKNKIGFYFKDTPYQSIININAWNDSKIRFTNFYQFKSYIHKMFNSIYHGNQDFNIFDLVEGKIISRKTFNF
ncbi:MAG: DUF1919 domain-containing protein [Mobilitalea sp.]